MSYGGSVQAMINSLKNNRLQTSRRKERVKNVRDYFREAVVQRKEFTAKEVSQEELNQIKAKIRKEAKKRQTRYLIVKIFVLIVFISLFVVLMIEIT